MYPHVMSPDAEEIFRKKILLEKLEILSPTSETQKCGTINEKLCVFLTVDDSIYLHELQVGDVIEWKFTSDSLWESLKGKTFKSPIEVVDLTNRYCCVYCDYGQDHVDVSGIISVNGIKTINL